MTNIVINDLPSGRDPGEVFEEQQRLDALKFWVGVAEELVGEGHVAEGGTFVYKGDDVKAAFYADAPAMFIELLKRVTTYY